MTERPSAHFASWDQQAHAARLGMWVFLGTELLLFAGLFTLWGAYRAQWPLEFGQGASQTDLWFGSANTVVLLVASLLAAIGVHGAEQGHARTSGLCLAACGLLGLVFLALKGIEYSHHVEHGDVPGAHEGGMAAFWSLYWAMTGLHAVHVVAGVGVVCTAAGLVASRRITRNQAHVVENCGNYWHLVDAIWLFLWPMFYLLRGSA